MNEMLELRLIRKFWQMSVCKRATTLTGLRSEPERKGGRELCSPRGVLTQALIGPHPGSSHGELGGGASAHIVHTLISRQPSREPFPTAPCFELGSTNEKRS